MAYIGHSPSTGEDNNFKILDDISSYTLTFDGSSSSVVSAANDTIYSYNHRFVQGQRVTYNNGGGGNINGLTSGSVYFVIKQDHNNIKLATTAARAASGTAEDLSLSGTSGTSHTLNVAFDGVNTKFKATHTTGKKARITRGAQLNISINGVIQQPHDSSSPSTGFGFDLDGTIVFSQAPASTDAFWGHILTNNNVTFDISDNTVDHFSGDGSTVAFTLSKTPVNNENVLVTIDGVVQYPNDSAGNIRAYSVVVNVITFTTAPGSGTQIEVRHIGFAGATSGNAVTGFYGRVGNATLKSTDNITVNDAAITGDATITGDTTITGDLTVNGTTVTLDTKLTEVDQILVGANNSTVAVAVTQSGSGDLLQLFDGSTEVFSVAENGGVGIADSIYHIGDDNTAIRFPAADQIQLETGGTARVTVTNSTTTVANNATFSGTTTQIAGNYLDIQDNKKLRLGTDGDCAFYFNGSATLIETGNKIIHMQTDASIRLQKNDPQAHMLIANAGGSVDLYHNGTKRFETSPAGTVTTGIGTFTSNVDIAHGTGQAHYQITQTNGNTVKMGIVSGSDFEISGSSNNNIIFKRAGSTKLTVTSSGIDVSGTVTATSFSGGLPITSGADNRVITASSASAIQGESTLTYDGTTLFCNGGTVTAERGAIPSVESKNSTSSSYARFYCSQTSGSGGYAAFQKLGTTSTAIGGANATQIWCTGDAPLVIGVNNDEKVRITSAGKVGIGITNPSSLVHLSDASGALTINREIDAVNQINFRTTGTHRGSLGANSASILAVHDGSSIEKLRITSAGLVGINTTNPDCLLHVHNGSAGSIAASSAANLTIESSDASYNVLQFLSPSTAAQQIRFGDPSDNGAGYIQYSHGSTNALIFGTNGPEKMRIDSQGKVGINTVDARFNNASQIASASFYHNDPKFGVHGSMVIGNLSGTATDERQLAFYRRGGPAPGTPMSTHKMGRIAWYGSSNDTSLPDLAGSIQCVPNGGGWTAGSNRRGSITFNNHEAETLRVDSNGRLLLGTQRTYGAASYYDDITINNSDGSNATGGTGITLVSSTNSWASILLGDSDDHDVGAIKYDHNTNSLRFVVNATDPAVLITSAGNVGIDDDTPPTKLVVKGDSDVSTADATLTIEDSDDTAGSKEPILAFDGNGTRQGRIMSSDTGGMYLGVGSGNNTVIQLNDKRDLYIHANSRSWSTIQNGNIRYHCRQHYSPGNAVQTQSLMRVKRYWWGWGSYKIIVKFHYYGSHSGESTFFLNGHGNNDSYAIARLDQSINSGAGDNYYGGTSLIDITSPSNSSPGNATTSYVDVRINIPNYTYAIIMMECMSSQYSTDPTSIGNDGYCLL